MASQRSFKVIIVGGGIAGLTLAIMLEKFDLDFVLLEAHEEITPAVGASIGLMPNGLLILDQIECYEPVKAVSQNAAVETSHVRSPKGKSLACTKDMMGQMEIRHGYPMLFFDRQWLLQVLYEQIKRKDRIIVRSRIETIEHLQDSVRVQTTDGSTYDGDIVVGADGVHSAVRQEMRRLASKENPGYFPPGEEDSVPCYYQCSFGIAQNVENWSDGDQAFTAGLGQSFLVVSGPRKQCYWFLFKRLPEVKYGKKITRYTAEDEAQFVQSNAHLRITEILTFGQLYAKRITSSLTPLHEFVFDKWFYGRMVLIGDSAHKPNPINGMGGNGAIESAAELVNAILRMKHGRKHGLNGLSAGDIETISREMQEARGERAKAVVTNAHRLQALYASERPLLSKLIWNFALPLTGGGIPLDMLALGIVGGARLEELPVPSRPRVIPFNHELPAKPLKSRALKLCIQATFLFALSTTLFVSSRALRTTPSRVGQWAKLTLGTKTWHGNSSFAQNPAGVPPGDLLDTNSRIHDFYALSQLVSPMLIYTIEGYRVGNQGTLLSLPLLFTLGMQSHGIGRVAPLHAIFSVLQASHSPAGRFVRPEVAEALLPALTLSYLSLTYAVLNSKNGSLLNWKALAQYVPVIFSLFTTVLSSGLRRWQQRKQSHAGASNTEKKELLQRRQELHLERYNNADIAVLRSVYGCAFAIQAIFHVAMLADQYRHSNLSPTGLVENLLRPGGTDRLPQMSRIKDMFYMQYDLAPALAGHLCVGLSSIWDLRRQGYTSTVNASKAAIAFVVCQVVLGPGAALAGLWHWKEMFISSMSTFN